MQSEFTNTELNTSELIPYANNSRTHSEDQLRQIAASIDEFGFTNPVIIDEDQNIVAGHGRVMAADMLGIERVPCRQVVGWTDAQKKAYCIADNQLALNAGWDMDILEIEIEALQAMDFNLDILGFDDDFWMDLFDHEEMVGLTDEDAVPEVPKAPVSVNGDIWILGKHRLMCGDSTLIDSVDKLLDNQQPDLIFTDPPYGMAYGGGRARGDDALNKKGGVLIKAHGMIMGDDLQGDELLQMVADSVGNAINSAKEGAGAYVCFTWRTYSEFHAALATIGVVPKACIVWDKKSIGLGNSNYRPQHEFIFYCGGEWYGDKAQSDVWELSRGATGEYVHPTQKPVELIEKAIINSSKRGDIIHDCFGGSGSTLIAGEKTGRRAFLMELDAKYVDVIIHRWEAFTGQQAVHWENDQSFMDVQNERLTE